MPTKKNETKTEETITENKEKEPKFKVMDPLNPAALNVPKEFDLAEACIDIEDAQRGTVVKYMTVQARKCWFLQNNPKAPMPETEFLGVFDGVVMYKAILHDENGRVIAMAHGAECIANYPSTDIPDAYMKAETIAIGRCLANRGYGIAFDEGETNPIDKAKTDSPIGTLNQMIDDGAKDTPEASKSSESSGSDNNETVATDFTNFTDLEQAVICLKTGFPISITIGNSNLKHVATWKVAANIKKAGDTIAKLTAKLQWGIDKGLSGVVNEEYGLTFDVYAPVILSLLNNKEMYEAALRKIKEEEFGKGK